MKFSQDKLGFFLWGLLLVVSVGGCSNGSFSWTNLNPPLKASSQNLVLGFLASQQISVSGGLTPYSFFDLNPSSGLSISGTGVVTSKNQAATGTIRVVDSAGSYVDVPYLVHNSGLLDLSFASPNGFYLGTQPGLPWPMVVYAMALDSFGKIVVGGYAAVSGAQRWMVMRLTQNGALDLTFNGVGYDINTSLGNSPSQVNALTVDSSGNIIAVGFTRVSGTQVSAFVRYNSAGGTLQALSGGIFDSNTGGVFSCPCSLDGVLNLPSGLLLALTAQDSTTQARMFFREVDLSATSLLATSRTDFISTSPPLIRVKAAGLAAQSNGYVMVGTGTDAGLVNKYVAVSRVDTSFSTPTWERAFFLTNGAAASGVAIRPTDDSVAIAAQALPISPGFQEAGFLLLDSSGNVIQTLQSTVGVSDTFVTSLAMDTSENVYLGGYNSLGMGLALRLSKTGSSYLIDNSYGNIPPVFQFPTSSSSVNFFAALVDPLGNLLLGGMAQVGGVSQPLVARILP